MKHLLSLMTILVSFYIGTAQKFRSGEIWKDNNGVHINAHGGGILHDNGVYYWYGEHKVAGTSGNKAQVGVHCYSSTNLYDWKDEGIVLAVSNDPKSDITKGCILERPKVIYNKKNDNYVMWFHLELKGQGYRTARSGIAVSDNPTGPFKYLKSLNPNPGIWPVGIDDKLKTIPEETNVTPRNLKGYAKRLDLVSQNILGRDFASGQMARDMTLFVDDDGKAYHIYSSEENSTTHMALLTDDYLSHQGTYVRVFPYRWMEAPAIFKHKGLYYFLASGCSGWRPNTARGAVAKNIMGPWVEFDNPLRDDKKQNALGPMLSFGGQSTFVLKVQEKPDAYIAMFDVWKPENAIDGRYIWLPITFDAKGLKGIEENAYRIDWFKEWHLDFFNKKHE